MAQRNPTLAVALLALVLIVPQMAASRKSIAIKVMKILTRDNNSDKISDLLQKFIENMKKNHTGSEEERSNGRQNDVGSYIVSFEVGTPPQLLTGMLDVNSELVWTQCSSKGTRRQHGGTVFYPNSSTTVEVEQCTSTACQKFVSQTCTGSGTCLFADRYIGNSTGVLVTEKFRFGDDSDDPVDVTFGCAVSSDDRFGSASGVIGLGRGPLSLVTQLGNGLFSYYFAPDSDNTSDSFVNFGEAATPSSSRSVLLTTPLLASSSKTFSNFYYVGLTGIQVDGQDVPITNGTFDFNMDGTGGVILTISISITFLSKRAYDPLRQALVSKIGPPTADGSELGLNMCYTNKSLPTEKIPTLALVFDGNAVMELEKSNYFYMDADTGNQCLTILESPEGTDTSVLGSLIQEGTHMIYDVPGKTLQLEKMASRSNVSSKGSTFVPPLQMCLSVVYILYLTIAGF